MHEVSLMQTLLETVAESAAANGITRVHKVKLVVGEMHGALPDALEFAFEVLTGGTVCAGAQLVVNKKPLVFKCGTCGKEFGLQGLSRHCPACRGDGTALVSGRELYVEYYEGD